MKDNDGGDGSQAPRGLEEYMKLVAGVLGEVPGLEGIGQLACVVAAGHVAERAMMASGLVPLEPGCCN